MSREEIIEVIAKGLEWADNVKLPLSYLGKARHVFITIEAHGLNINENNDEES